MLAGLLGAGPALADCSSDVAILKARVEREPDPLKAGPAKKQLLMAQVSAKDVPGRGDRRAGLCRRQRARFPQTASADAAGRRSKADSVRDV